MLLISYTAWTHAQALRLGIAPICPLRLVKKVTSGNASIEEPVI